MTPRGDADALTKAFKALSNPNRLRIYQELVDQQIDPLTNSGCKLVDVINSLKIGAPTISHHVKELANADLIRVERQGRFVTCHVNDAMRDELRGFFR
ncbi:ArsR family transcriptional regulator [Tamilnaduibacter salinus]|uniref:Transcriptional regulator n=1 Tax=Tamilnaduibacter salinus TaxID=1484056 RepID=A0A2A2I496_9GAMM|nr:metalloregulator ArsR/SmtB family transcription factor [Tamilnaduibacter salinus]PAV26104.1 transcriptional regulator [Tamilnaduibacter salinus]PVY77380.1 ArsR family transcriptional regulator [Tamilnaduibacter salinus]